MERVMSEILNYCANKNEYEIHLILYGIKRDVFYHLDPRIIVHKPEFLFNNKFRFWNTLKTIFFLRKKIVELNAISVLSFGEYWNNLVLLSLIGTKQRVFVSDRCDPEKSLGKLHDFLRMKLYPNAYGIIVQTLKAKQVYTNLLNHPNFTVIGNPIRKIHYPEHSQRENIVLTVGRFIKSKNIDKLIQIFSDINPENWKFYIVGDDDLKQNNREHYVQLIDQNKMSHKIKIFGFDHDIDKFYVNSKLFIFASESEGFPNVVGEALSAGLPVVTFDSIPGIHDLLHPEYQDMIIQHNDIEGFKSILSKLMIQDYPAETSLKVSQHIENNFDRNNISEKYFNLLIN